MSANVYVGQPTPTIDLGRALKWMFSSPNWVANFFWVIICLMLGAVLVGHMVLFGYQIEIFQRRARGRTEECPDFTPDKFVTYLMRGLIPFALNFLLGIVSAAAMFIFLGVWGGIVAMIFGSVEGAPALILLIPLSLLALLYGLAVFLVVIPLTVRAALTNNLADGFKFSWAIATVGQLWPTMLLCLVYAMVIGIVAQLAGILMCVIGLIVTIPWAQLALTDLAIQAHDIYEAKGGEPIQMVPVE